VGSNPTLSATHPIAQPAMIEFGHATHPGLHRSRNEDTYIADGALGLFLVADGMGGQQLGDVASATTRDTTVAFVPKASR